MENVDHIFILIWSRVPNGTVLHCSE